VGDEYILKGHVDHPLYCYHTALYIIAQIPAFLQLRIQLLLKLAAIYASGGGVNAANDWSKTALAPAPQLLLNWGMLSEGESSHENEEPPIRILHLQLNPGTGEAVTVGFGPLRRNELRDTAYLYFLKEVVNSSIAIDLQVAEISEPRVSSRHFQPKYAPIFNAIVLYEGRNSCKEWVEYQRRRLEYVVVLCDSRANIQNLQPSLAKASVSSFLSLEPEDLMRKADMIQLAVRYGNPEKAHDICTTINNEDIVPLVATRLAPPHKSLTSASMIQQQRVLLSLEMILSCAISARQWQRPRELTHRLEQLSPGYFTSDESHSSPAGQRLMWAALIFTHQDGPSIAWTHAISALSRITEARIRLKLSHRGHFDSIAKASRAANLLVQLSIHLQEFGSVPDWEASQFHRTLGAPQPYAAGANHGRETRI